MSPSVQYQAVQVLTNGEFYMDLYEKQAGEKILRENGIKFDQVDGVHQNDGGPLKVAYRRDFQDFEFNAGNISRNQIYSEAKEDNKKKAKGVPKDGSTINEDVPEPRAEAADLPPPSGRPSPASTTASTETAREYDDQKQQREKTQKQKDGQTVKA